MNTNDATKTLIEAGAVKEKREDSHGETKTGWWMDGVWLGKDAREAVAAIRG